MIHNRILITTINMRIDKCTLRINQYQSRINRLESNVMLINSIRSLHNHRLNIMTIDVGKDGKEILKKKSNNLKNAAKLRFLFAKKGQIKSANDLQK